MQNFYKIIKPITNTDILTIYRKNDVISKNRLCIDIHNKKKNNYLTIVFKSLILIMMYWMFQQLHLKLLLL